MAHLLEHMTPCWRPKQFGRLTGEEQHSASSSDRHLNKTSVERHWTNYRGGEEGGDEFGHGAISRRGAQNLVQHLGAFERTDLVVHDGLVDLMGIPELVQRQAWLGSDDMVLRGPGLRIAKTCLKSFAHGYDRRLHLKVYSGTSNLRCYFVAWRAELGKSGPELNEITSSFDKCCQNSKIGKY